MPQAKKTRTHNQKLNVRLICLNHNIRIIFMEFVHAEHPKPFSTVHHFHTLLEIGNRSLFLSKSLVNKHQIENKTNNHIEFK